MFKWIFYAAIVLTLVAKNNTNQNIMTIDNQIYLVKEDIMQHLPDKLRLVALQYLHANYGAWWVRDVTASYGKLDVERLYWIIDSEDNSITIAQLLNGEFSVLSGTRGLALSSQLLSKAYGDEPWRTLGVEKLGKIVVSWYRDSRSYILTEAFFSKQQPVLNSWLTSMEKDPATLHSLCYEPVFALNGDNWMLDFNAINRQGGVEHWVIKGQKIYFMIKEVVVTMVKRDGTFNFPDEL
jgi:hypothetical protein